MSEHGNRRDRRNGRDRRDRRNGRDGRDEQDRRDRRDYERGLPGYHDPTAGFAGSSPARSALTLRAVLAGFGLVFCTAAAVVLIISGLTAFGIALAVLAAVALVDLSWVIHRKRRGEPG